MRKLIILLIICVLLFSCRFQKPFPSIRISKEYRKDSTIVVKRYKFIRISQYGIFGHLHIEEKYDTNGVLLEKSYHKYSALVRDGRTKVHRRIITFSQEGTVKRVDLKITKNQGRGAAKYKLDKTILYDDNGKRNQIINNLEN
ncbi:MAG: hypothetical protein COA97_11950 [Flavobacteriales bacterium]|nr:MAG: hypothetical protein COA97_11950 [Flavobacteriales bacterium]